MNKKIYLILIFIITFSHSTFSRGPAIEPGQGISIDQYDHSKNKNDPGFNWKQSNEKNNISSTDKNYRRKVANTESGSIVSNILLTSLIILFPVLIWFSLRKVGDKSEEVLTDSVVSLDKYRKDSNSINDDEDDQNDSFSKAS